MGADRCFLHHGCLADGSPSWHSFLNEESRNARWSGELAPEWGSGSHVHVASFVIFVMIFPHISRQSARRQTRSPSPVLEPMPRSISSLSDGSRSTTSSYDEDEYLLAQQEWEESLEQLQQLVGIVLLPFIGKYLGRRWSHTRAFCSCMYYSYAHNLPSVCEVPPPWPRPDILFRRAQSGRQSVIPIQANNLSCPFHPLLLCVFYNPIHDLL